MYDFGLEADGVGDVNRGAVNADALEDRDQIFRLVVLGPAHRKAFDRAVRAVKQRGSEGAIQLEVALAEAVACGELLAVPSKRGAAAVPDAFLVEEHVPQLFGDFFKEGVEQLLRDPAAAHAEHGAHGLLGDHVPWRGRPGNRQLHPDAVSVRKSTMSLHRPGVLSQAGKITKATASGLQMIPD